jgi:hypothetical protein
VISGPGEPLGFGILPARGSGALSLSREWRANGLSIPSIVLGMSWSVAALGTVTVGPIRYRQHPGRLRVIREVPWVSLVIYLMGVPSLIDGQIRVSLERGR